MAKIGRRGRLWLRAFHIFFMGLWIGGVVSGTIILLFSGHATSDDGLKANLAILHALDIVTFAGGFGTIITGVLLAWLTPWGFFKYKWVIYTIVIVVVDILIAQIWGGSAYNKMTALAGAEGLSVLQNPEYISAWNQLVTVGIVTPLLLISAAFVSVLKPWRKHEGAETAA